MKFYISIFHYYIILFDILEKLYQSIHSSILFHIFVITLERPFSKFKKLFLVFSFYNTILFISLFFDANKYFSYKRNICDDNNNIREIVSFLSILSYQDDVPKTRKSYVNVKNTKSLCIVAFYLESFLFLFLLFCYILRVLVFSLDFDNGSMISNIGWHLAVSFVIANNGFRFRYNWITIVCCYWIPDFFVVTVSYWKDDELRGIWKPKDLSFYWNENGYLDVFDCSNSLDCFDHLPFSKRFTFMQDKQWIIDILKSNNSRLFFLLFINLKC